MKIKANRTVKSKVERIDNNSNVEDRTTFFYYAFRNILLVSLPLLIISGFVLSHLSFHSSATDGSSGSGSTDSFTVSISSACTISSVVNSIHNIETNVGTYVADVGKTTIKTLCNDGNGYAIYANGYSNNEEGNNKLINSSYPQYSIDTGLATSGLTSAWAMKLNNIENDPSPTPPVIEQDYNNTYGIVPNYWTKVASRPSGTTDMSQGSSFTTTYSVYASSSQFVGTYLGQVKYLLTHPDDTNKHIYFMQEVDTWENTLAMEESVQAIDKRDGKSYWVTKLKDGNVWMTQNLDLCIGCDGVAALTSENTDISTTASGSGIYSTSYGYSENNGVWTWTPASTAITANHTIASNNSVSNWADSPTVPYSVEGGDIYYYTSNSTANDTKYTSLSQCTQIGGHTEAECKHYHAGNYYNWSAAIATNNSSSISSNYSQASNSICPKGWRLPIATNSNQSVFELGNLLYTYDVIPAKTSTSYTSDGFNSLRQSPLWFTRSGYTYDGTLRYSGENGRYWSNTVVEREFAYNLNILNNSLKPASNNNYRSGGYSLRCLAR